MILCHPLKLIFIKTKKVGGTSFEIALSSYCGDDCIITPITPRDEDLRTSLGFRGPQNFNNMAWPNWPDQPSGNKQTEFYNHIHAEQARKLVPPTIWKGYRKVAIYRNPFDAIVSRFFWRGGEKTGVDFNAFVKQNEHLLYENLRIAPLSANLVDTRLRYEHLDEDIEALGIPGLGDLMSRIRAKAEFRPESTKNLREFYRNFPDAKDFILKSCAKEIADFGYRIP